MIKITNSVALFLLLAMVVFSDTFSSTTFPEDELSTASSSFVIVTCPANVSIACTASSDPSSTGMATVSDGEAAAFSDSTAFSGTDKIIFRSWFSVNASGTNTDTCLQTITLESNAGTLTPLDSVHVVSGFCSDQLDSLVREIYPLTCDQVIESLTILGSGRGNTKCGEEEYQANLIIRDDFTGQTGTFQQYILIENVPPTTVTNIRIDSAMAAVSNGAIHLEVVSCNQFPNSYSWSNGSTDSIITDVPAGDYSLTITNAIGCLDSFSFKVPQIGAVFVECPPDITLACGADINLAGTPERSGGQLTVVNDTVQACPITIIDRKWILSSNGTALDSCSHRVTIQSDATAIQDTMTFTGMCPEPIESFVQSIGLQCNEVLDSSSVDNATAVLCGTETYTVSYFISDNCQDTSYTRTQTLIFEGVPAFAVTEQIAASAGDSTGSIAVSFTQCRTSETDFLWSTGSTDSSLTNLPSGNYGLTLTDAAGCTGEFMFEVQIVLDDISCPADITVSCDASLDPINLGFPTGGANDDFNFTDSITQTCPSTIIERSWLRKVSTASADFCVQRLTLTPENARADFRDTVQVSGVCGADLEAFVNKNLPLSCGETVLNTRTFDRGGSCEIALFETTWFVNNECQGQGYQVTQFTQFVDIAVADLQNIIITPDPTGMGGAISFDAMSCLSDSISYTWSNGSTDAGIDNLNSGDYSLTLTNEAGCTQELDFTVPIFLSLTCPDDITIDCEIEAEPSVTGMAMVTGFDSVRYVDVETQGCPSRIIERSWIASISGGSLDTCVQIITQVDDNLRANFMDTVYVSGQCSADLEGLVNQNLPLGCNERINFVESDLISSDCTQEIYRTDWFILDECTNNRTPVVQFTVFNDLKVINISETRISPAVGDSTGAIAFDFTTCKGEDVTFEWSTGSMDSTLTNIKSGTYTLTVTSASSCTEELSFDVPLSFGLICPDDIVIGCDETPDPSITGMAIIEGFDSLAYTDSITQICPNTLIERTWTGSSSNAESVSCIQLITLNSENVRNDFMDTIRISGACAADLMSLVTLVPPLKCGESVSTTNTNMSDMDCNSQTFRVDWYILDDCNSTTSLLSQVTVFEDISVIDMTNLNVTADQEDNSGAISFDHTSCGGDVSFLWSNGSTDANLSGLSAGAYSLTVTSTTGCIDSFDFDITLLFSLNCPLPISLTCTEGLDSDVLGMPSFTGYETITFSDSIIQQCPDQRIERTYTAMTADSSVSEFCRQIITLRDNSNSIREDFPAMRTVSGLCTDDVISNPAMVLDLGCNEVLDSTLSNFSTRSCDGDQVNFNWFITNMCTDSSYTVNQLITFIEVPVITIDSVTITPAQGGPTGSIKLNSYSSCDLGDDGITFAWNTGGSADSLAGLDAGEYELIVTNTEECVDTLTYIVPTDFSLICPDDIVLSCNSSSDTSVTGVPLLFGFSGATFTDSILQSCPDQIIQRTWTVGNDMMTETCVQTITLENNADIRDDLSETLTFTGACTADVEMLVMGTLPLNCNETLDSSRVTTISEMCSTASYNVDWFITDGCGDTSYTVSQMVVLDSIPFVTLSNINVTGDNDASGIGSISFDITSCDNDDLAYIWSNDSTSSSLSDLAEGVYMLTVSNSMGCSEEFNFEVDGPIEFDSTKALTITIEDRAGDIMDGVTMKFLSTIGREEIRGDLVPSESAPGKYVYTFESEVSEVGFLCPSFEDAAIRDVSSIDIVRGQRLVLGISQSCPEDFVAADVNFSGNPSAADLVLIRRVILGLDQNYPPGESWKFVKNEAIDVNDLPSDNEGCIPLDNESVQSQTINLIGIKLGDLQCPD